MAVRTAGPASTRPLRINGLPLGLGALKPSEDGDDYVLRCYEPHGARGDAIVDLPVGWELAAEVTLLEARTGPPSTTFGPFQVRSWRVAPAS
jgi:alpha-mannosidase